MSRLREGRVNTARAAAHFLRETVGRVRYGGVGGQLTVRADRGFYAYAILAVCCEMPVRFSITIRRHARLRNISEAIPETDWTPIPSYLDFGDGADHRRPSTDANCQNLPGQSLLHVHCPPFRHRHHPVRWIRGYAEGILSGVAVLTNGKDWYIYNLRKRGDFSDKLTSPINLLDCNVREAARTLHAALDVSNWWESTPHRHNRLHRQNNGQPRSIEFRKVVRRDTKDTALAQETVQQVREATRQVAVLADELENLMPCDRYIRHSQASRADSLAQQATRRSVMRETSYRWRVANIPVRHVIDSSRNSCLTADLTRLRNCRNAALPAHCTSSLRHDNLASQLVNWQRRQPTTSQRC